MCAGNAGATPEEGRFTALEMKFAYLENIVRELQSVVTEHSARIDALKLENAALREKLLELAEAGDSGILNARPPHY